MPTVLRDGPYRVYFFSNEGDEPPHVHVDRERFSVKFWLGPLELARNIGFKAHELRKIEQLLEDHELELIEVWHEHFEGERG